MRRFEYQLDPSPCEVAWSPATSVLEIGPVDGGEHVLRVRCASTQSFGATLQLEDVVWTYEPTGPSTVSVMLSVDGEHTVGVRAEDAAANLGVLSDSYTFTLDTVPPDTYAVLPWWDAEAVGVDEATLPSTSDRVVAVNASALEPDGSVCELCQFHCIVSAEGVQASLPPTEVVNCSSTAVGIRNATLHVPITVDGVYTLSVQAVDGAANHDPSPVVLSWLADVTAPNSSVAVVGAWVTSLVPGPHIAGGEVAAAVNTSTLSLAVDCSDGWQLCGFAVFVRAASAAAASMDVEAATPWPDALVAFTDLTVDVTGAEPGADGSSFTGRLVYVRDVPDGMYVCPHPSLGCAWA